MDAVLLASFIEGSGFGLELGAGFGPVSLMLKARLKDVRILALDILVDYLLLLEESLKINGFSGIYPVAADVRRLPLRGKFDFVFSNPPYLSPEKFRVSPKEDVAVSKWEIRAKVEDFLRAAFLSLKDHGEAFFVVGAEAGEFSAKAGAVGFGIEERVEVLDGREIKFLLYRLKKVKGREVSYRFKMKEGGKYTPEMEEILSGAPIRPYLI